MNHPFEVVQGYIRQLAVTVLETNAAEQMLVVEAPERGIHDLVLDCEDDILVIEQVIAVLPDASAQTYRELLQINRQLIHGAFCLDESGSRLIFRDTLQLENLDYNEVEGSINALSLALAENSRRLIAFAQSH